MKKKNPPLFKRIALNDKLVGEQIAEVQLLYERMGQILNSIGSYNSERKQAIRRLQESCMWMSRAVAVAAFDKKQEQELKPDEEVKKKPVFHAKDANLTKDMPMTKTAMNHKKKHYESKKQSDKQYGDFNLGMHDKALKEQENAYKKSKDMIKPVIIVKKSKFKQPETAQCLLVE